MWRLKQGHSEYAIDQEFCYCEKKIQIKNKNLETFTASWQDWDTQVHNQWTCFTKEGTGWLGPVEPKWSVAHGTRAAGQIRLHGTVCGSERLEMKIK